MKSQYSILANDKIADWSKVIEITVEVLNFQLSSSVTHRGVYSSDIWHSLGFNYIDYLSNAPGSDTVDICR